MSKREVERARKRMSLIVGRLQEYVRTYSDQAHYDTYSDTIFIDDMLYGIGIALEPLEHQGATGFDKFKEMLRNRLAVRQPETSDPGPDDLCRRCRHSYTRHTKGPVVADYCRHCACNEFIPYSQKTSAVTVTD